MAVQVERGRRFTADEFERMVEAGVFRSDERLELIRGEIVEMAPIGHRHSACVANLTKRLVTGVEVAETSLRYDRTRKLRLYAAAGIAEYWVVSVADGCRARRERRPARLPGRHRRRRGRLRLN